MTATVSPRSIGRDELALRHDDGGFDLVLHLADVAGPGVRLDRVVAVFGEALDDAPLLLGELVEQVLREQQPPALALAQRRDLDRDLADAVVEILAERARRHRLLADSCSSRRARARRRESPRGRRCARSCAPAGTAAASPAASRGMSPISSRNSVPPSATLDLARRLLHGARERALLEAEQLRLEQRVRDRGAVDGDERLALRDC